jgi:hypothetical protein
MPSYRAVATLAIAAALTGLVAVASGATTSGSTPQPTGVYVPPVAHAAGGSVATPTYPSLVNTRMVRAQAALDSASALFDQGQAAAAAVELAAVRTNLTAAWAAEQYYIEHAPPPVAGAGSYNGGAHTSGSGAGAGPYASPEDTGFAVLTLQHTVLTTALGFIDTASGTSVNDLRLTIRTALKGREGAIAYVHKIPPPPPAGKPQKKAKASGGAIASSWATVMPNLLGLIDDEIQQIKGTRALNPTLTKDVLKSFSNWRLRDVDTKDLINKYWPPLPAG